MATMYDRATTTVTKYFVQLSPMALETAMGKLQSVLDDWAIDANLDVLGK